MELKEGCLDCKWHVLGPYKKEYGGRPIGCSRPEEITEDCKRGARGRKPRNEKQRGDT